MTQRIFTDFSERHGALIGRHTVNLGHSLAASPLLTDAALAELIERAPLGSYRVSTMDVTTHDPRTWRQGVVDGLSGLDTLEAVRRGHIWIWLQHPGRTDPRYRALLESIYAEWHALVPGFKSYRHKLSIMISSPRVQLHYHADAPGQTLWQVRGRKRVHLYPNAAPFLPQEALERIALGEGRETALPYEPWFDDYAEVFDLEPGRMLHWPPHCPHRIVNADCLNVAITTEHWTDALRNAYAVNFANGILRRNLGGTSLARPASGPGLWARRGLAAAWRMAGVHKRRQRRFKVDFKVDLDAPWCVRSIPPFELSR